MLISVFILVEEKILVNLKLVILFSLLVEWIINVGLIVAYTYWIINIKLLRSVLPIEASSRLWLILLSTAATRYTVLAHASTLFTV